jgi:5-methylcytosine-specific restriction endonuclease McrA
MWKRDQGKCQQRGGRTNLQYEHILAVSHGRKSTVENLELLCSS